jgi:hypothetical protein
MHRVTIGGCGLKPSLLFNDSGKAETTGLF